MLCAMHSQPSPLSNKQLYIEHLAQRLQAMESGMLPSHPMAYRLCARRLRQAMAEFPESRLAALLAETYPVVAQGLEDRHFEAHGAFAGASGMRARKLAAQLVARLKPGR